MSCMICGQEHAAMQICGECEFDAFVRNHFFTGKMMGAAEFATETLYHSDKMRHHNARLHGAGAVCGLKARQHPAEECRKRYVVVSPGSALDCCGREILVAQEEIVDVAQHRGVVGALEADRRRGLTRLHTLQLCVAYRDCPTEDVPVLYDECGCDDAKCAPNRILESFHFDVLVDPPLPSADLVGKAPLGAFVATDRHAVAGFSRASAAGKVLAADPGSGAAGADPLQPTRLFILDTRFRSMKIVPLPAAARAAALSADGNFVFAVTASTVRIFKVEDASEIVPATPAQFDIPGAGATGALYAGAGRDESGFIAYVPASGDTYRWKAHPDKGLDGATRQKVTLEANLSAVTTSADGKAVYGIAPSNKVKQYLIAASGTSTSKEFAPTTTPSALAAFTLGAAAKPMLAVASRADKRVYVIDLAPTPVVTTIDLERPPAYVGAAGSGDDVWLHVLEEESAHLYTQAVSLKPMAAAGQPLLAAPRLAWDGARAIVLVFPEGQAGVVHPAALADSDCADHLWKQLEGCPPCELPDCVGLATIVNYQPDMALTESVIDNRLGRRVVASTATLQAWLQCLQLKGGIPGPKGDPGTPGANGTAGAPGANGMPGAPGANGMPGAQGDKGNNGDKGDKGDKGDPGILKTSVTVGNCSTKPALEIQAGGELKLTLPKCCDGDLTHICDINWEHGKLLDGAKVKQVIVAFDGPLHPQYVTPDQLRHSFIVETHHTQLIDRAANLSVECWCQLGGEYKTFELKTPCDIDKGAKPGSTVVTAIGFTPSPSFLSGRIYRVRVLGDLILDTKSKRAVDANHLPPYVPARKSGDCIEGGTFESWFKGK